MQSIVFDLDACELLHALDCVHDVGSLPVRKDKEGLFGDFSVAHGGEKVEMNVVMGKRTAYLVGERHGDEQVTTPYVLTELLR